MSEEKIITEPEVNISSLERSDNQIDTIKILQQLEKNQEVNRDILKAVNFIKRHYFWRSIFNGLKVVALILVIVLGIVSWRSIVEYITSTTTSYIPEQFINSSNNSN